MRSLIKEPPSEDELRSLATNAGGANELVAPKRRAEIDGMSDPEIIAYLAEDSSRLRRPIIVTPDGVMLGFNQRVQDAVEQLR